MNISRTTGLPAGQLRRTFAPNVLAAAAFVVVSLSLAVAQEETPANALTRPYAPERDITAGEADAKQALESNDFGAAERAWRRAAWLGDDFLSQVALGDWYRTGKGGRPDDVEAFVWYYLACIHPRPLAYRMEVGGGVKNIRKDDVESALSEITEFMLNRDKTEAQNRIIYILRSRGTDGYKRLAQIYDPSAGTTNPANSPQCNGGFKQNAAQQQVYLNLADGEPPANGDAKQPPFEYYPDNYWDASFEKFSSREALRRIDKVPEKHIKGALTELNHYRAGRASEEEAYADFQQRINEKITGELTPVQKVRAIQIAAVQNHTVSQKVLGTMYSNGFGVVRNFDRAEYWFRRADEQGDDEAQTLIAQLNDAKNGASNTLSDEKPINSLRRAAWLGDDLFAQVELGDIYSQSDDTKYAGNKTKQEIYEVPKDNIEAFVWYYLALINPSGLDRSNELPSGEKRDAVERAGTQVDALLGTLLNEQINEAHLRVIQVLSSRGAEGFVRLGEIYDERADGARRTQVGNESEIAIGRPTEGTPASAIAKGFEQRNLESYVYYLRASLYGHKVAEFLSSELLAVAWPNDDDKAKVEPIAKKGLAEWQPPFELYPEGYWDASLESFAARDALQNLEELQFVNKGVPNADLQYALIALEHYKLGANEGVPDGDLGKKKSTTAIRKFQEATLGLPEEKRSDVLTAAQIVRLVQHASERVQANSRTQRQAILRSQNTLGVMYYKGIGVIESGPRAVYWFEKAAARNDPRALRNLAEIYQFGAAGLDVDLDRANNYRIRACRAGYSGSDLHCFD